MGKSSASSKSKEAREARKAEQRRLADCMRLVSDAKAQKGTDIDVLCGDLMNYNLDGQNVKIACTHVTSLSPEVLSWAIDLTTRNMKKLYEQCAWGWNLRKKTEEMSEDEAWYAVARAADGELVAFSHFRFDMDHGDTVVYCYELQVEEGSRGRGLGARLLAVLERLAQGTRMQCVRLTALRHNPRAAQFFRACGYSVDETSPDPSEAAHYEILSKYVQTQASKAKSTDTSKQTDTTEQTEKLVGQLSTSCTVSS